MKGKFFESHFWLLWMMVLPLMLSSLSEMGMLFSSRLILARYDLIAHNAAVEATNIGWAFLIGWHALGSVTQIFVAQNYGAGQRHLLGHAVWQMIWVSVISIFLFIPLAYIGSALFFGEGEEAQMQSTYFFWMMVFGPSYGLFAALCGFFVGQGKTALICFAVVIGNVLNTGLCYLLVFGCEGICTSWGVKGAALATSAALLGQVVFLLFIFLKSSNRREMGTGEWQWRSTLVTQCLKIGSPSAFFMFLEIMGWAVFYKMMSTLGQHHLTVAGIVQNILVLFNFFGEGLFRAVSALSGNALGAKKPWEVSQIVRSGFVLMTCFTVFFGIFMFYMHESVIDWFLDTASVDEKMMLYSALVFGLANAVIYKYLEGIRLVLAGALTAAADTLFLLIGGSCCIWCFMVLPVYIFVVRQNGTIEQALGLCSLYTLLAAGLYAWRFYSRAWERNVSLVAAN